VEPLLLLRGVRAVVLLANPSDPRAVSQRAFDDARQWSDYTDLPVARQIARELGLSWRDVIALAREPEARQAHGLGLRSREWSPRDWLTAERIMFALRLVAGRRRARTLTMGAYDAERGVLLAADARDWRHGRRLRLPDAEAIRVAAGGWDAALRLAGLEVGSRPAQGIRQVIPSRLDVMDRFHDYHGEQPTKRALEAFARGNGIPMSDENKRAWSETVKGWRQRRRERGLADARAPERKGGRGVRAPDYSANVGAARPGEQPHRGKWSDEADCVAWVARYVASLPAGERSTQDGYRCWAGQHPGAPNASRLAQHGGWEAVRRKALARNAHALMNEA
jgi:hypothetical protein